MNGTWEIGAVSCGVVRSNVPLPCSSQISAKRTALVEQCTAMQYKHETGRQARVMTTGAVVCILV